MADPSLTITAPLAGLCADIGGSFIRFAPFAADASLGPLSERVTPAADWQAFTRVLRDCCTGYDPRLPMSVSVAGVVAPGSGRVRSANLPCIDGRPLAADLSAALGRPVEVANDAGCAVLAEALGGAGRGFPVVFGVVLGTGVGGGFVVDGRLVPGAGEWGHGPVLGHLRHGTVDLPPQPCGCGQRGCLDTLGGARGLERLDGLLHGGTRTSLDIVEHWAAGDPAAATTIALWRDLLAGPLALVAHATGAGCMPVSGGLGRSVALVEALDAAVRQRLLIRRDTPFLVPARLGRTAGLVGAALRLQPATATHRS